MKRPPVKIACARHWLDYGDKMQSCKFVCTVPGKTVLFKSRTRGREDWYAIMHPSALPVGATQVTLFDKHGPSMDVRRTTCQQALDDMEIVPQHWRLATVAGAPRAVQARLRRASRKRRARSSR